VLILGDSGTGKELLARLIHREAGDTEAPFIAVNLAAIPRELAESALFGHERGAFTGAHRQQLGKFELASNGTLFLDEIGDLRLDLQAKLLRAIQEGEIERVGGTKPIKTEFRLIAATNVDLEKAVKEGRFREDLFYRLNVIPIKLPPLRERTDDVPQLAEFFLRRYNTRFRKRIQGISESTMTLLKKYWWPGNIRELENLIERLVAVSDKDYISEEDLPLEFHCTAQRRAGRPIGCSRMRPIHERNFILRAEKCVAETSRRAEYLWNSLEHLKYKMDVFEVRYQSAARSLARPESGRGGRIGLRPTPDFGSNPPSAPTPRLISGQPIAGGREMGRAAETTVPRLDWQKLQQIHRSSSDGAQWQMRCYL
jgi:transcriptional regulator with PAS, ATPase and Fis domain